MEKSKTVLSNIGWRFLERCGAQGVQALVEIILARLLDVEHFGAIALITVLIRVLQVFVDSGLANALIQKKDADQIDFSSVFYFNLLACVVLYGLMFAASPLIAQFYSMPELTPVIRVLSLVLIISGVKGVQQAYVSKHMMFKKFFWATITGTIAAACLGIWMAWRGYGIWALVAQHLLNTTVDTLMLWFTVKWRPTRQFSFTRLRGLLSYGWKLLASSLLNTIYGDLRQLVIGKAFSSSSLAIYNRGKQMPLMVVSNINVSINSVLLPAMSLEQDNRARIKEMVRRAIKISTYLMMPLLMGLAVCADTIVRLILTEKWLPCVFYLRVFCFTYAFHPIHTANLSAIKALGRSDIFLKQEITKNAVDLALLFTSVFISLKAMAISVAISSVISQIVNSWPNRWLIDYHYRDQLKDILPQILLSCLMGAAVYTVSFLGLTDFVTLLIQIPLGIMIYAAASKLFKIDSYDYVLNLAKGYLKGRNMT